MVSAVHDFFTEQTRQNHAREKEMMQQHMQQQMQQQLEREREKNIQSAKDRMLASLVSGPRW